MVCFELSLHTQVCTSSDGIGNIFHHCIEISSKLSLALIFPPLPLEDSICAPAWIRERERWLCASERSPEEKDGVWLRTERQRRERESQRWKYSIVVCVVVVVVAWGFFAASFDGVDNWVRPKHCQLSSEAPFQQWEKEAAGMIEWKRASEKKRDGERMGRKSRSP